MKRLLIITALFFSVPLMSSEDVAISANQLMLIEKLLNDSTGAQQIFDSDNREAKQLRMKAVDTYEQAVVVQKEGDIAEANRLLSEAAALFFSATRMVSQHGVEKQKTLSDMERLRESIRALLKAHERVAKEKDDTKGYEELLEKVTARLAAADEEIQEGREKTASQLVQEAYLLTRSSLGQLRDGDTLIKELNFETPADEYRYELDRNDTHLMLVVILLDEKSTGAGVGEMSQSFVKEAKALRKKAETFASKEDYPQAIEMLESSTRELVRAIRIAGIYIPN